jgi:hypothetical protein
MTSLPPSGSLALLENSHERNELQDGTRPTSLLSSTDPREVNALFENEIKKFSVEERNRIQEELHGVWSPAQDETLELIQVSLHKFATELRSLPPLEKQAYLKAQTISQQRLRPFYCDHPDVYIRFLRAELWDAKKAAKRMAMFLDLLLDYFGVGALQRPIQISDFSDDELKAIKTSGEIQLLPARDRSGRRILAMVSNMGYGMNKRIKVSTL